MAITDIVRFIDPDSTGGDGTTWTSAYNSMTAWEAAEDTNLVTSSQTHTVYCQATSGTNDNSQCLISGWTMSSVNYLKIIGNQATTGSWSSTKYILNNSSTTNYCLRFANTIGGYIEYHNLQMLSSATYITNIACTGVFQIFYDSCILKRTTASTNGGSVGMIDNILTAGSLTSQYIYISNCLLYDSSLSGARAYSNGTSCTISALYNNTFYNVNVGIRIRSSAASTGNIHYIKNNRISAVDCFLTTDVFIDDDNYCNYNYITENNSTDVAVGTNGAYNQTFYYVNEASRILIPASSDPCVGTGLNLSTDAILSILTDMTGSTRGTTYDIGSHQVTISAGTTYLLVGGIEISMSSSSILNIIGLLRSGSEIKIDISSQLAEIMALSGGSEISIDASASINMLIFLLAGSEIKTDISSGITSILKIVGGSEIRIDASSIINLIGIINAGSEIKLTSSALLNIIALLNGGSEVTLDSSADIIEVGAVAEHLKKYGTITFFDENTGTVTLKLKGNNTIILDIRKSGSITL